MHSPPLVSRINPLAQIQAGVHEFGRNDSGLGSSQVG